MRRAAELECAARIMRAVNKMSRTKPPARAYRLAQEARNCVTIAVGQKDAAFAGDLIDEAIMLSARARELAA